MSKQAWILGIAASMCLARVGAAGPILLPNTGQNVVGGLDQNYQIISDTTGLYTGPVPGDAVVVTSQPGAWATLPGTSWIGPSANQNFSGQTNGGDTTYQTTFSLLNTSTATLAFDVLVDNAVNIYLNGTEVANIGAGNNLWVGYSTPALISIGSEFQSGVNTLTFEVLNGYGPTGLDVKSVSVPEFNWASMFAALTLLFGGLVVVRGAREF